MEQKEVKIIGLRVNERFGILESFNVQFDNDNRLIAIKGEVGSGKTTLQRSLQLGTVGSDTLKDDKSLYGRVDQEVQLLDGDTSIFIGCKSNKSGGVDYVIYTRDDNGKIRKDPIVDGVKLTPASYLRNLQTALTWRMRDLCSENLTTQKNLLLELYKSDLAGLGVVFDKKDPGYADSILGKIDLAINRRAEMDYRRKQIGGFANQLEDLGIDVDLEETLPKRKDIATLEARKNKLSYAIENVGAAKLSDLRDLKNQADAITNKLSAKNIEIESRNRERTRKFEDKKSQYSQNIHTLNGIKKDVEMLVEKGCIDIETKCTVVRILSEKFENSGPVCDKLEPVVEFSEDGKCLSVYGDWDGDEGVGRLLLDLSNVRDKYVAKQSEPDGDTTSIEEELQLVINELLLAKENNKRCDMVKAYLDWRDANDRVFTLRDDYAKLLRSVNTGVDGLNISIDTSDTGNLDIYLTYNGVYDPGYFNNPDLENRKLSSYSGTQKPLICLLLQSYLLGKKPKAMRYLWIDDVPIDAKTRALLNRMGDELSVTIFVNITGDFKKEGLTTGEILVEGGHVFFN